MKFNLLIEDFLGYYSKDRITYTLDINASLSELPPDCRGMILPTGDLITLRNEQTNDNRWCVHMYIFNAYNRYLMEKNEKPFSNEMFTVDNSNFYELYDDFYKYLFVQRFKNTNFFYLGESYEEIMLKEILFKNEDLMETYKTNFENKNKTKELIFKRVHIRWSN